MRLITRNDTSLAIGLIAAAVIVFQQPLRALLDLAQEIEGRYHLNLVPALMLLTAIFVFHQYRKRDQARAEAQAAASAAAQALARNKALEQLMAFGEAVANALDRAALQNVLWKHLPAFSGQREAWVAIRGSRGGVDLLLQDASPAGRPAEAVEQLARRVLGDALAVPGDPSGREAVDDVYFALHAGGSVIGVLGVRNSPVLSDEERKVLAGAAALIAIGVKNMQLFAQTRELSLRDALTGCYNRAHTLEALDLELRRVKRTGNPLSILMFDIDHFKAVNDRFGHLRGDELLGAVGIQLGQILRSTDIRCRYGGDEFLLVLPDTPALGAQQVAECLRQEIAKLKVTSGDESVPITISLGVAAAMQGETDPKVLIERADEALYRATRDGRDRFCVAIPPTLAMARAESAVVSMRQ
jgi:diguanylate cyclase (GGDEF)-like protein